MKTMKKLLILTICSVFFSSSNIYATDSEVEMLKNRVSELERTLTEVKAQLAKVCAKKYEPAAQVKTPIFETSEPVVCSKYNMCLYGYMRLDAAYDNQRTNGGNFVTYVQKSDAANKDDNEFNMTAKQTRLGIKIDGPPAGDAETFGKLEVDFYGSSTSETSAILRFRHAYLQLKYPNWDLLAGQTWDIFSSSNFIAPTINFTQIPGDIGINRHPQLRLVNYIDICDGKLTTTFGVMRNGSGTNDAGEDSAYPEVAGSVAWKGNVLGMENPTTILVSGVYGQEEDDANVVQGKDGENYDVYGGTVGVIVPVPGIEKLSLKAEAWTGRNLNGHSYGGITSGYSTVYKKEIDSEGGWAALTYKVSDKLSVNAGAGVESAEIDYLSDEDRCKNVAYFGNFVCKLSENVSWGLEYMRFETDYARLGGTVNNDAEDDRVQGMIMYVF